MEPRGFRNNNFGNLIDSPFSRAQAGYVGSDGKFAIYDTPQSGMGAMDSLLASYGRRGINTVEGAINRWAPPVENNTNAYSGFVSGKMGLQPGATIDLSDPAVRQAMVQHISTYENGKTPTMDGGGTAPMAAAVPATPSYGAMTPAAPDDSSQIAAAASPQANPMMQMAMRSLGALGAPAQQDAPPPPLLLPPMVRRPAPFSYRG